MNFKTTLWELPWTLRGTPLPNQMDRKTALLIYFRYLQPSRTGSVTNKWDLALIFQEFSDSIPSEAVLRAESPHPSTSLGGAERLCAVPVAPDRS